MIKGQVMKFPEFELLAGQFPTIFYPAFRFQHHIRVKCLGEDWWVEKLRRYAAVRKKMAAAGAQTDLIAELEMQVIFNAYIYNILLFITKLLL
jgi:hypothetical protein